MSEFDKVIGYDDIKAELKRFCDVLKNPEKYKKLGVTMPKGILLYGDPGLGKSLIHQRIDIFCTEHIMYYSYYHHMHGIPYRCLLLDYWE